MKIIALSNFAFAENGHQVCRYRLGGCYDVSPACAAIALTEGWAKPANQSQRRRSPSKRGAVSKSLGKAPENKKASHASSCHPSH